MMIFHSSRKMSFLSITAKLSEISKKIAIMENPPIPRIPLAIINHFNIVHNIDNLNTQRGLLFRLNGCSFDYGIKCIT